jgi:hypothetical protein
MNGFRALESSRRAFITLEAEVMLYKSTPGLDWARTALKSVSLKLVLSPTLRSERVTEASCSDILWLREIWSELIGEYSSSEEPTSTDLEG